LIKGEVPAIEPVNNIVSLFTGDKGVEYRRPGERQFLKINLQPVYTSYPRQGPI
jgi:hypothetical protein